MSYILKIAYSRLWAVSRLKSSNVSKDDIFYFYTMKIRSVLEYASPVFFSMLTNQNIADIERIQKIVLKVILGHEYVDYDTACKIMSTTTLHARRKQLALRFALSCLGSQQHRHLFKQRRSTYYELRNIKSFELPQCFTHRYASSPIPAMINLLNEYCERKGPASF